MLHFWRRFNEMFNSGAVDVLCIAKCVAGLMFGAFMLGLVLGAQS